MRGSGSRTEAGPRAVTPGAASTLAADEHGRKVRLLADLGGAALAPGLSRITGCTPLRRRKSIASVPFTAKLTFWGDVARALRDPLRIQLRDNDADNIALAVEQRPAGIALLHGRADLELRLVVAETGGERAHLTRRQRRA